MSINEPIKKIKNDCTDDIYLLRDENNELCKNCKVEEVCIDDLKVQSPVVYDVNWQTQQPLCLFSISHDLPFRLRCETPPSPMKRLLYCCFIQGYSARCLFDTGANCSLMSLAWAKRNDIEFTKENNVIHPVSQEKMPVMNITVPLRLQIGDYSCKWQFYLVAELAHDILLGTDFILFHRVTYDPFDWSLLIFGNINNFHLLPTLIQRPHNTPSISVCAFEAEAPEELETEQEIKEKEKNENNKENRTKEIKKDLEEEIGILLHQYPILIPFYDLFHPIMGNPPQRIIEHTILLKEDAIPIKHNPYPVNDEKRNTMIQQINEYLDNHIIEPSFSPWSSPILFVSKKDGGWRMCVDFRSVNAMTKHDAYPLPRINVLLQKLGRARYYTKLDLASGFHQVPMNSQSKEITAFCIPEPIRGYSHFQWKVMPFGLINAPATFQRLMEYALHDLQEFCVVYIDDILIFNNTMEEHVQCVVHVLRRLMKHKLFVKVSKCSFFQTSITFLGHQIGAGYVMLEPEKINKIRGWDSPLKSAREVRKFWGLVSWCGMYIPGLASLAAPLTALSGARRKFIWTAEAEEAMKYIKEKCLSVPILLIWDADRPTRITTDASDVGIGAVLEQFSEGIWRPVEYWSQKLKPAETRYSATDKEWLAVIDAVSRHWRYLLEGKSIIVQTDHKPLIGKLSSTSTTPPLLHRHLRWIERLAPFSIKYQYVSGKNNTIADALSRAPEFYAAAIEITADENITLKEAICLDGEYQQRYEDIKKSLEEGGLIFQGYNTKDSIIYRPDGTMEVPNNSQLRLKLLEYNHDHPMAGHFGRDRTLDSLRRKWFWKGIVKDVEEYVKSCDKCQRTKARTGIVMPAIQPIVPKRPWSIITLDFVGSFCPAAETGNTECLVMVDKFTKMVHLASCKKDINAKTTAYLVLKHVISLHGVPEEIISDRGPQFDSLIWKEIWQILGARVKLAAPQHPQTDGQSERNIKTFLQLMRAFTESQKDQWEIFLPVFEFALNNAYNSSTGMSPFFANFGRHPRMPDALFHQGNNESTVVGRDLRRRLTKIWQVLSEKLQKVASDMILRSTSLRSPLSLEAGDHAYLAKKRQRGSISKQEALYSGPYPIKRKLGRSTYILSGTPSATPPIQNIQYLKKFEPSPERFQERKQRVAHPTIEGADEWEVEKILSHRGNGINRQYLIKWKDSEETTWVPPRNLENAQEILQEYLMDIEGEQEKNSMNKFDWSDDEDL